MEEFGLRRRNLSLAETVSCLARCCFAQGMLNFYIVAGLVGGLLILVSLFGASHGHDGDGHVEFDAHGHESGSDHVGAHDGGHDGPWIPFFSVRFWTYFMMAFGLCGLLLSRWIGTPEPIAAYMSGGTGLLVGLMVSYGMRALSRQDLDSSVSHKELMGKEAQVLVAIRPGQMGRVRLSLKGEILDVLAVGDDTTSIEAGEAAIIVDMEGDRVKVVSRESVFGSTQTLNA